MKAFVLLIIIIILPLNVTGQVIKTDTSTFNDSSKVIIQYERKRIIYTYIIGEDTTIDIDNSLYYTTIIDSLKHTQEYFTRDTISFSPNFLFIHLSQKQGDYGENYHHMFIYYDTGLISNQKGIILINDYLRRKYYRFIDQTLLDSIINILNSNMSFNFNGIGFKMLPEHITEGLGMPSYRVSITAKDNDRVLYNEFYPSNSSFGFGKNTYDLLVRIAKYSSYKAPDNDFRSFRDKNLNYINSNDLLVGMLKLFETTTFSDLKF